MSSEKDELTEQPDMQARLKKPYATPQLTVYGDVEKITGGFEGEAVDDPMGSGEP